MFLTWSEILKKSSELIAPKSKQETGKENYFQTMAKQGNGAICQDANIYFTNWIE